MTETEAKRAAIHATLDELGLTITSEFVPCEAEKWKDLRLAWKITVQRKGLPILSAEYSAGIAHCPSYNQHVTVMVDGCVRYECRTGRNAIGFGSSAGLRPGAPIEPDPVDVLACLAMDAEAIDYSGFEDWAESTGYDPDSRKAEGIYNACLKTGLALRNALGESGLAKLREAFQDW